MAFYNPFPHYSNFEFSPVVPNLYWNVYSPEQRIKALCYEYAKLTKFTDSIVDTINDQYAIIHDMNERFPQLVNDDVIAEMHRLVDAGEFDAILQAEADRFLAEKTQQIEDNANAIAAETQARETAIEAEAAARNAMRSEYAHVFATVADMAASDELASGMVAVTEGFHTAGDNGAAVYLISDAGTADGMSIIACSNGMYAHIQAISDDATPEQYGAIGNGSNDDTDSLQKMYESGCHVFNFAPGKVYVTQGNNVPNMSNFRINGCGAVIRYAAHNFATVTREHDYILDNCDNGATQAGSCGHIIIDGVVFDGNKYAQANVTGAGRGANTGTALRVWCADAVVITGCKFINCFGNGVYTMACANVEVSGCTFDSIGNLSVYGTNTTKNCMTIFNGWKYSATGEYQVTCDVFKCNGNTANGVVDEFVRLDGYCNSAIYDNNIRNLDSIFIELYPGFNNGRAMNVDIHGNKVFNEGHMFVYVYAPGTAESISRSIAIHENIVENLGYVADADRASTGGTTSNSFINCAVKFDRVLVENNRIRYADALSAISTKSTAFNLNTCDNVAIIGNVCEKLKGNDTVIINTAKSARVNGNMFDGSEQSNLNGVYVLNSDNAEITDNIIKMTQASGTYYGSKINNVPFANVRGNKYVGCDSALFMQNQPDDAILYVRGNYADVTARRLVRNYTDNEHIKACVASDNVAKTATKVMDGSAITVDNALYANNLFAYA